MSITSTAHANNRVAAAQQFSRRLQRTPDDAATLLAIIRRMESAEGGTEGDADALGELRATIRLLAGGAHVPRILPRAPPSVIVAPDPEAFDSAVCMDGRHRLSHVRPPGAREGQVRMVAALADVLADSCARVHALDADPTTCTALLELVAQLTTRVEKLEQERAAVCHAGAMQL